MALRFHQNAAVRDSSKGVPAGAALRPELLESIFQVAKPDRPKEVAVSVFTVALCPEGRDP
jgi:hypothetical protein